MVHPSSLEASGLTTPFSALANVPAGSPWGWEPAAPSLIGWEVSLLRLQGADSRRFLHGQTSQAIELASPGQWLSTCCISPTGRMRALAEVLVTDDGAWLMVRAGDGEAVREALDRVLFPADAVTLGPLRAGRLLEALPEPTPGVASVPRAAAAWRPLEGGEGFWLGEGLLLLPEDEGLDSSRLEPTARDWLHRPLLEAAERERWRIQIGLPASPAELNDDTNPFELGLAERVSLSKGCYVGQETLAKLATYDGVKQQLRRWTVAGPEAPSPGDGLILDGVRAGAITSALPLPGDVGWIGLAMVRRAALEADMLAAPRIAGGFHKVCLSKPDRFVDPPVGAGGTRSQG